MIIAIIIMLISAASYSLSYVLQHKGTQASIGEHAGENASVARLIRNPVYVIGVVLFGVSFLLHLAALSFGSVAVVQPLIVTELIFIPPLSALISKARISGRDWLAILGVAAGLAGFLIVAQPTEGDSTAPASKWWAVIVGMTVIGGVIMMIGAMQRNKVVKAAVIGTGVGVLNALLAIVARGMFGAIPADGVWTNPLTWVTVIVTLSSIATTAFAFRSGPITASSPAMIAVNPVISTLVAMWLFHVAINDSPLDIVLIILCIVVINIGIVVLSQSKAVHSALEDSVAAEPLD